MRLYLKQWYIHKEFGWGWKELENYERVFDNFEIITNADTDNIRVGYLLAYTEKAIKVIYVNSNNTPTTKYIPISAVVVIDEKASMLSQCLLYKKMNNSEYKHYSDMLVKEFLKTACVWQYGYVLDKNKYIERR